MNSFCPRKGGEESMDTSEYEKTIDHQFDSFCKVVLRNQARNIYTENKRRNERFVVLDLLTQSELNLLSNYDTYDSDYILFQVYDFGIAIEDILIAQALESLSKKQ